MECHDRRRKMPGGAQRDGWARLGGGVELKHGVNSAEDTALPREEVVTIRWSTKELFIARERDDTRRGQRNKPKVMKQNKNTHPPNPLFSVATGDMR